MSLLSEYRAGNSASRSTIWYRADSIVLLIVVYFFWIFTTPYNSNRLAFLATIQFEKLLAGALILLILLAGRYEALFDSIVLLALTLLGLMFASDLISDYSDDAGVHLWRETYWKKLVLMGILAMGLRRQEHIHQVLKGMILVIFFYQAYSWFDFLRGGSYVYQQGMKRMCGTWSGGGIGAANAFGSLGVFALPFYRYWFQTAHGRNEQKLAVFGGCMSVLSILFSGTRGALVVAVAYLAFTFRKSLWRPKVVLGLAVLALLSIPALPEEYKHRYWDLLIHPSDGELSKTDQTAIDSGKGRLQGMLDGFELGMQNPIFGVGPERSAAAAHELRGETASPETELLLELHNLYGQTAAELGLLGLLFWAFIIVTVLRVIIAMKRGLAGNTMGVAASDALLGGMLVMLAYGLFSHSLYDWRWLILFGCTIGLRRADWLAETHEDE